MSGDSDRISDPIPEHFAGTRALTVAKRLFSATRPKFFTASALPVIAGTAWGANLAGGLDGWSFLLALLATVCVHAGANVLNDVGDDASGTDRNNTDRIYPYTGGSRFIQTGILSSGTMARLGITALAIAAIAGALLLLRHGETILWFGVAGVALAVLYSLGPARLCSLGVGELAVGVGLGVLPVMGAAWLQSGQLDTTTLWFSVPISIWVAAILLINEVPDISADRSVGKRTLPVRFGLGATAVMYFTGQAAAMIVVAWLTLRGALPLLAPLLPMALLWPAFRAATAIRAGIGDRRRMTAGIESTLMIHAVGTLWLTGCVIFLAVAGAA